MIPEIEARPFDRRVHHCQAFDALRIEGWGELRNRRDMAPAKGTMQASIQSDQHRFLAAEIVDGDLALAGNRVEHEIGRPFAKLQRACIDTV